MDLRLHYPLCLYRKGEIRALRGHGFAVHHQVASHKVHTRCSPLKTLERTRKKVKIASELPASSQERDDDDKR
jgi:hypothetical protein